MARVVIKVFGVRQVQENNLVGILHDQGLGYVYSTIISTYSTYIIIYSTWVDNGTMGKLSHSVH